MHQPPSEPSTKSGTLPAIAERSIHLCVSIPYELLTEEFVSMCIDNVEFDFMNIPTKCRSASVIKKALKKQGGKAWKYVRDPHVVEAVLKDFKVEAC